MKRIFLCIVFFLAGNAWAAPADDLPLAAGLCVNKANLLIQKGNPGEAVKVLEAFRNKKKQETHYYIDFLLGNSLMMMETSDKTALTRAAMAYERALAKAPDLSHAWLNLAQCRYSMGKMARAGDAFIKGYETAEEKRAVTLYYGAACRFFAKQHHQALETFSRLIKDHGPAVKLEWKEILVNTLFALERNKEALPWLRELAEKSKGRKKKQWQEVLLYQYLTLKMDKAALDYALFLTRTDPTEPKWWKSLTHIHLDKNRLEKGLRSLMVYGFITPLSPSGTSLLADLYSACNIPLEAARCYGEWVDGQRAGGGDPQKIAEKIFRMANAYMRGGDNASALSWADKGLAMASHRGLLRLKADILFREKQYDSACCAYERLAEFKAEAGRARLMAGYAAWNMNRLDKAEQLFKLAAASSRQKKAARTALAQIRRIRAAEMLEVVPAGAAGS
ncbi:MAG: tetratricopeptide repeat protein [Desulfobacter sp.]|nr:MAG: tetratricopeptide repeat protein [Desulfobacter sp.]